MLSAPLLKLNHYFTTNTAGQQSHSKSVFNDVMWWCHSGVVCVFQVWLVRSRSRRRRTLTRWWRCGTDHQTSCWAAPTTPLTSTCGQYYSTIVVYCSSIVVYCSSIVVNCCTTTECELCDQLTKRCCLNNKHSSAVVNMNWISDILQTSDQLIQTLMTCLSARLSLYMSVCLTLSLPVCLTVGVLVVFSMRWRQVDLCFLVPRWRRSFTSSSSCWVRTNQLLSHHWEPISFCYCYS